MRAIRNPWHKIVAAWERLKGGETVTEGDLAQVGLTPYESRFVIHNLRYELGIPVQTDEGYYVTRTELALREGDWVKTPEGIGQVKYARDGWPSVRVKGRFGEGKFERAVCSTVTGGI